MRPRNFRCEFLQRSGRTKHAMCEGIFRCSRSVSVKDLQHVAPTSKLSFLYQNLRNQKTRENSAKMNSGKMTYADVLKNPSAALNPGLDPKPLIRKEQRVRLSENAKTNIRAAIKGKPMIPLSTQEPSVVKVDAVKKQMYLNLWSWQHLLSVLYLVPLFVMLLAIQRNHQHPSVY